MLPASRIVVAEDDIASRDLIVEHLRNEGFEAIAASDGFAAIRAARDNVDLAIIDLGLPGVDGLNVLRTVRGEGLKTPMIVLTGRSEEVDRIVCFELGADDFVVKPFFVRELLCRVRNILRRTRQMEDVPARTVLRFGRLEIDENAREARIDGVNVGLRPKEFSLLLVLARNAGLALSRKTLIERAWGFDYEGDERTVDGHVRRIRRRLEEDFASPSHIATIYGFGYKFVAP